MMPTKERLFSLDAARAFAIFCVVICHVSETVFPIYDIEINAMGYPLKIIPLVLRTIGTLGVPLFLYMTGFLLLHRPYDSQATSRFYRTRFLLLLAVSTIWTVLWRFFRLLISGGSLSLLTLWKDAFFASGAVFSQIWYLPMILNLYLLVPFLSNALHAADLKWIWRIAIILLIFQCGVPLWNHLCECLHMPVFYTDFHFKTHISFYILLAVLGHLARRDERLKKIPKCLLLAVAAFAFASVVFVQLFFVDRNYGEWISLVQYNDPLLLACTFALLLFFLRTGGQHVPAPCRHAAESLSRCSFGIYLIHFTIIDAVSPLIMSRFSDAAAWVILMIVTLGGSWLFVKLFSFHPKLRKYLFFMH